MENQEHLDRPAPACPLPRDAVIENAWSPVDEPLNGAEERPVEIDVYRLLYDSRWLTLAQRDALHAEPLAGGVFNVAK